MDKAEEVKLDSENDDSVADEWRAGCFSQLMFSWVGTLVKLGHERQLQPEDLGAVAQWDLTAQYLEAFEDAVSKTTIDSFKGNIWRSFSRREFRAVACKMVSDALSYVPPLAITFVVNYTENPDSTLAGWRIYCVIVALFLAPFIMGICNHWFYQLVMRDGLHARIGLQAAVYAKALRISNQARQSASGSGGTSRITNLQSADCRAVEMLYWMWMYIWAAPLQVIVTIVLLYLQLGYSIFAGVAILVLFIPIQKCIAGKLGVLKRAAMLNSDERIRRVTEVVTGIKVVKLQAWEPLFESYVQTARSKELESKYKVAMVDAINRGLVVCGPLLSAFATFAVYSVVSEEPLTASAAFTSLALFNLMRMPFMVLPMLIGIVAGFRVATERLSAFMYSDELQGYVQSSPRSEDDEWAIKVEGATFSWGEELDVGPTEAPTAADSLLVEKEGRGEEGKEGEESDSKVKGAGFKLSFGKELELKPGSITVGMGTVGAGKSSLLQAILGEMELLDGKGSVRVNGTTSYCAQEPWITNATLRDNVLFGQPFDQERYDAVVDACALRADFGILPGGDATEIGQKGINLSGGQKARVSLARAVYAKTDIILLDDILSAVDAHVGLHIVQHCVGGLLRDKKRTVILCTHQTVALSAATNVLILDNGQMTHFGAPNEPDIRDAVARVTGMVKQTSEATSDKGDEPVQNVAEGDKTEKLSLKEEAGGDESAKGKKQDNVTLTRSLTTVEKAEKGAVKATIYVTFAKLAGIFTTVIVVLMAISMSAAQIVVNWWLSRWSVANSEGASTMYFLGIYAALSAGTILLIFTYNVICVFGGIRAAKKLHGRMLDALLTAPLQYFDVTPRGRLINRFSLDIEVVDGPLISAVGSSLELAFFLLAILLMQAVVIPWIIIALVPLSVFYYWVQIVYRNSSRELKRLDSISMSPVFNHFSETLEGLSTIRAFSAEQKMVGVCVDRLDTNTRAWTKNNFVNRWMGLRLDIIGAFLVGGTGLACVLAVDVGDAIQIDPGLVGLVLSYTIAMTSSLNWGVRKASEVESAMVAMERCMQLAEVPGEAPHVLLPGQGATVPEGWPSKGVVEFKDVSARYRSGLPLVLTGVNVSIPAKTKVGICGRTGSGKSTIALTLTRILEASAGEIVVDGINVANIGLRALRSKITMIPQDPVMFAGPLRYSLDPGKLFSDEQIWGSLTRVQLDDTIRQMGGLEALLTENGDNLSAGQKQLLCMARALLEKPTILIMDEATSNISGAVDDQIQKMIREDFKDCTVLTIAHRINTIVWYDHVIVLDQGKVIEQGNPRELAKVPTSEFGALLSKHNHNAKA